MPVAPDRPLLLRDPAFVLVRSGKQMLACVLVASFFCAVFMVFAPPAAALWIWVGALVGGGSAPLIAGVPVEWRWRGGASALNRMRDILSRSHYAPSSKAGGQEVWVTTLSIWQRWVPATDIHIRIDGDDLVMRGPRGMIARLRKLVDASR